MTGWTAIIPLKPGPDRKSRLAPLLSCEERRGLGDRMARHVVAQLCAVGAIKTIFMLAPDRLPGWPVEHIADKGRGLNAELDAAASVISGSLLVIHADLPLVSAAEIAALISAAEASGAAIAPDRHGLGTNALAFSPKPASFAFAFGAGSFARHQQRLGGTLAVVRRAGLACDIDTPADLAHRPILSD